MNDLAAEGKAYAEHPGTGVLQQLCELAARFGPRFEPAALVVQQAAAGTAFEDRQVS